VIDLHCHLLPGLDDGPADLAASLALARAAAAAGTTTIVATPHVSWEYRNDAAAIAAAADAVRPALVAEGVGVEVRLGAEVAVTYGAELAADELARLRLGGGEWLLVEPPFTPSAGGLELLVHRLQLAGHRVLLAHPERSPALRREPELLRRLVDAGCLCSVTAGSLAGRFGGSVRRFADELLAAGMVHNVASDAHDATGRSPELAALVGDGARAGWMVRDVPAAILDGGPIPPAPAATPAAPRRRPWRRRP